MRGTPGVTRRDLLLGAGGATFGALAGAAAIAATGGRTTGDTQATSLPTPSAETESGSPSPQFMAVGETRPAPDFPVTMAFLSGEPGLEIAVWVWRAGTLRPFTVPDAIAPSDTATVQVSPDCAHAAWLTSDADQQMSVLYAAALADGAPVHTAAADVTRGGRTPYWLPQNSLVYSDTDGETQAWSTGTPGPGPEPMSQAVYSADGTRSAYTEDDRLVVLTARGEVERRVSGRLTRGTVVTSLSPGGRYAVVGVESESRHPLRHGDRIVSTTTGAELLIADGAIAEAAFVGDALVVRRLKGGDPVTEAYTTGGRRLASVRDSEYADVGFRWL
ncbi:MAG: hypothetical protein HOV79_24800 [Hamadaea sp.]|nr:hypothetical protein [Hamadaea sp.]